MGGGDRYWFDVEALEAEPEGPARPVVADLRSRWSGAGSVKGRLASLREVDAKALLKDVVLPDRPNPIE